MGTASHLEPKGRTVTDRANSHTHTCRSHRNQTDNLTVTHAEAKELTGSDSLTLTAMYWQRVKPNQRLTLTQPPARAGTPQGGSRLSHGTSLATHHCHPHLPSPLGQAPSLPSRLRAAGGQGRPLGGGPSSPGEGGGGWGARQQGPLENGGESQLLGAPPWPFL